MVNFFSVFLVFVGAIVGSLGTLLFKKATQAHALFHLWKNIRFWIGGICYALSVLFYIFALRREQLSVVYPLGSISYLWITLFSVKFLGEKMNQWKWLGLLGILLGIMLIGIGS